MMNEKNFNFAGQRSPNSYSTMPKSYRHMAHDKHPTVFTDIYQSEINIAIWQRKLPATLQNSVKTFLALNPAFQTKMILTPQDALSRVSESFNNNMVEVSENIAELVDMFCYLFAYNREMYLPITSNSRFIFVPTSKFLKLVCSCV